MTKTEAIRTIQQMYDYIEQDKYKDEIDYGWLVALNWVLTIMEELDD